MTPDAAIDRAIVERIVDDAIQRRVRPQVADVAGMRCEPVLRVGMNVDANVDVPEERLDLERGIASSLVVPEHRIFTAVTGGAALHNNFVVLAQLHTAEFWSSIDRHVESLESWLVEHDYVDDPGRDLSVTLDAGDPEMMIRREPGATA